MGQPYQHVPAMLLIATFSRYPEALNWTKQQAEKQWGAIALESPYLDFNQTTYYEKEMGPALNFQFLAFDNLVDPLLLPDIKLYTNSLEKHYATQAGFTEPRPLNIDPGYLTLAKFVLATTKDASHRLYLDKGIFGEVTLRFIHGAWQPWEWTYPNYRDPQYQAFLLSCRQLLLTRWRGGGDPHHPGICPR